MSNSEQNAIGFNSFSLSPCVWPTWPATMFRRTLGSIVLVLGILGNPLFADASENDDESLDSITQESTEDIDIKKAALEQLEHVKSLFERRNPNDSDMRSDLAHAYQDAGLYEDALEQFLWCFDEGPKYAINETWSAVRTSFLLGYIQDLAEVYPPARDALVVRRDSLFQAIQANESTYMNDQAKIDGDFAALTKYVGDDEFTLWVFDWLKNDETVDRTTTLREFVETNLTTFDEHRLFDEIVRYVDMKGLVDHYVRSYASLEQHWIDDPDRDALLKMIARPSRKGFVGLYRILMATGRLDDAKYAAGKVIGLFDDATTYNALAAAGIDSTNPSSVNVEQARKAVKMEPSNATFVNTLVQVLHATGETHEGVGIANDFLSTDLTAEERTLIEGSLDNMQ